MQEEGSIQYLPRRDLLITHLNTESSQHVYRLLERLDPQRAKLNIHALLDSVIIPRISSKQVSIADVIMWIKAEEKRMDPSGEGVNILLDLPLGP